MNASSFARRQREVLLHSCCAPCSCEATDAMIASGIDSTIFFYNPNTYPRKEYDLRKDEKIRFAEKYGISFVAADCNRHYGFVRACGMESEPERGKRCTVHFDMRFERTALHAREHGFPGMTSSLGISRWKDMQQINDCGIRASSRYPDPGYWDCNWRKGGGSARMIDVGSRRSFYREEYRGCAYFLRDINLQRKATNREPIRIAVQYYGKTSRDGEARGN